MQGSNTHGLGTKGRVAVPVLRNGYTPRDFLDFTVQISNYFKINGLSTDLNLYTLKTQTQLPRHITLALEQATTEAEAMSILKLAGPDTTNLQHIELRELLHCAAMESTEHTHILHYAQNMCTKLRSFALRYSADISESETKVIMTKLSNSAVSSEYIIAMRNMQFKTESNLSYLIEYFNSIAQAFKEKENLKKLYSPLPNSAAQHSTQYNNDRTHFNSQAQYSTRERGGSAHRGTGTHRGSNRAAHNTRGAPTHRNTTQLQNTMCRVCTRRSKPANHKTAACTYLALVRQKRERWDHRLCVKCMGLKGERCTNGSCLEYEKQYAKY